MVIWTAPQRETSEAPTFSLTGVLVSWPDGAPALVKQTPFAWHRDAWQACVEVSRATGDTRYAYGTIRLEPIVAATWRRRRVNPRREAATQLRNALQGDARRDDLGVVTFSAV
jgi:hypothetical protein